MLREKECADEIGLWRPERDVPVVDIHHVRCGVEAILLSGKIIDKRGRRKVARCAEGDTHVDDAILLMITKSVVKTQRSRDV